VPRRTAHSVGPCEGLRCVRSDSVRRGKTISGYAWRRQAAATLRGSEHREAPTHRGSRPCAEAY
jgi:hypothetical protein